MPILQKTEMVEDTKKVYRKALWKVGDQELKYL